MRGCFDLFIKKTHPIVVAIFVFSTLLIVSSCSTSRSARDRHDKKDADDTEDTDTSDGGVEKKASDSDGSFGSADEDGAVNDPIEIDSGDARDPIVGRDGSVGPFDNRDAADAEDELTAGSGGSESDEPINIPYDSLQQIPNSSARACPDNNFMTVPLEMFSTCDEICPNAHCVDNFMISMVSDPDSIINVFYPCGTDASCIPDQLIATQGAVQYKKCRSIGNLEGACLSVCNRNTASSLNANFLPQDSCYENEVCIPCFDPIKGGVTAFNPCGNYVSATCNEGAKEDGVVFDKCCGGSGTCVPGLEDINPQVAGLLGRDSCTGEDDLCLPSLFGIINYLPAVCQTDQGDAGRCLSDCLSPSLTENYSRGNCASHELCIPCTINGESSGACSINDDEPNRGSDS